MTDPRLVLVIDDDPHVRGSLDRDLASLGCVARLVGNASDALARLDERSLRYDCVIVDHYLRTSRADFIEYLVQHHPEVPRILLCEAGLAHDELAAGRVQAVLDKPWQLADLERALAACRR